MSIKIEIIVDGIKFGSKTSMVRGKTTLNEMGLALAQLKIREKELIKSFESGTIGFDSSREIKK